VGFAAIVALVVACAGAPTASLDAQQPRPTLAPLLPQVPRVVVRPTPPRAPEPLGLRQDAASRDVAPNGSITVGFDRDLVPLLPRAPRPTPSVRIEPALPIVVTWRDAATLRVTPMEPLTPGRTYRIIVDTPLVALDGAALESPAVVRAHVAPVTRRQLLPELYADGESLIDPHGTLRLVMRGAVDSATWAHAISVRVDRSAGCAADLHRYTLVRQRLPSADEWVTDTFERPTNGGRRIDTLTRVLEYRPDTPLPSDCRGVLEVPDAQAGLPDRTDTTGATALAVPAERYRVRTARPFQLDPLAPCRSLPCAVPGAVYVGFTVSAQRSAMPPLRVQPAGVGSPQPTSSFGTRAGWMLPTSAQPGELVRVLADTALRDMFGRTLVGENAWSVRVPDRTPDARLLDAGLIQRPRHAPDSLAVWHVNTAGIELRAVRLRVPGLLTGPSRPSFREPPTWAVIGDTLRFTYALSASRNEERTSFIAIPDAVRRDPRQPWLLEVRVLRAASRLNLAGTPWADSLLPADRMRATVLIFSDLAVHAHLLGAPSAVFVTDARTGAPVSDASVTLRDSLDRVLGTARTQADGTTLLALGTTATAWRDMRERATVLEVTRGDDTLRLPVQRLDPHVPLALAGSKPAPRWTESVSGVPPWSRSLAFADRELYRAGERVYFGVIRRAWDNRGPQSSAGDSVRWTAVTAEFGGGLVTTPFDSGTVRLSAAGIAVDSLHLPHDLAPSRLLLQFRRFRDGAWREDASVRARIAEYRAPEFLVQLAGTTERAANRMSAQFDITSRYLHDAPMSGAHVRWSVTFNEPWTAFPALFANGWQVGRWRGGEGVSAPAIERRVERGVDSLDARGARRLSIDLTDAAYSQPVYAALDVTVTDVTRQEVTATTRETLHPSAFYLAARRDVVPTESGTPTTVSVRAVTTDGATTRGARVSLALVQWRREHTPLPATQRVTTPLDTIWRRALVLDDTLHTIDIPVPMQGVYELVLTSRDSTGQRVLTSLDVSPSRPPFLPTVATPSAPPVLRPLQEEVPAGTPAGVEFESAFDDAEAWLTLDREGTLWQWRARVARGVHRVSVPTTGVATPGAYLSLLLVPRGDPATRHHPDASLADRTPVGTRWQFASVALRVGDTPSRLTVRTSTTRARWAPGDTATLDLEVRDGLGATASAEVIVWAVDEGVLALSDYTIPDPHRVLNGMPVATMPAFSSLWWHGASLARDETRAAARRPWFLRTEYDDFSGKAYYEMARGVRAYGVAGGAPAPAPPEARRDVRATAFFVANVRTDSLGRARVRAALPQGITRYRVIALAVDTLGRAGRDSTTLQTYAPLVVRAAMPRFVRPGDVFRAGAAISSADGLSRALDVWAHAPALAVRDSVMRLPRSDEALSARFLWSVPDTAPAQVPVTFVASTREARAARNAAAESREAISARDAVRITLPVSRVARPFVVSHGASIDGMERRDLELPADASLNDATLTITLGTGIHGALAIAVERALQANSDGLEPLAGRLRWLASRVPTDSTTRRALRQEMDSLISQLRTHVDYGGEVHFWPGVHWSTGWLTAYAALAVGEARAAGATVPTDLISSLVQAIQNGAIDTMSVPYGSASARVAQQQRVWSTMLARTMALRTLGTADTLLERAVVAHRESLRWDDLAWLAELLHDTGHPVDAAQRLADAWFVMTRGPHGPRSFADAPSSDAALPSALRGEARLLRATRRIQPNHPRLAELESEIATRLAASATMHDVGWVAVALDASYDTATTPTRVRLTRADGSERVDTLVASTERTPSGPRVGAHSAAARAATVGRLSVTVPAATYARVGPRSDSAQPLAFIVHTDAPSYAVLRLQAPSRPDARRPVRQGFDIERRIESVTDGLPITTIEAGMLVRVVLRVRTSTWREFVRLEDALPAGLEPIDGSLNTTTPFRDLVAGMEARTLAQLAPEDAPAGESSERSRPQPHWFTRTIRADGISFTVRELGAGLHTVSYLARAITSGRFVHPSALVYSELLPEVSGRTAASTLEMVEPTVEVPPSRGGR
jgi:hypothetical protein